MKGQNVNLDSMGKRDAGVRIRDGYLIVGYFHDWLVAENENEELFVMEEPAHVYDSGTYCDSDAELFPVTHLPQSDYEEFIKEFLKEV